MLEPISPFGPKIGKSIISEDLQKILLEIIADPDLSSASNKLISYVKHEKTITPKLFETGAANQILDYIIDYVNNIEPGIYQPILPLPRSAVTLQNAWVNIQREHEFHPLHDHRGVDLVCVIYPQINIKTKSPYETRDDRRREPGALILHYGHQLNYGIGISEYKIDPVEREIYVFPADLNHYTLPIFGNDLRVSISCNFTFSENVKRKLSEHIQRKFYQ